MATCNPKVFFAHVLGNRQISRQTISLKTNLGVIGKEPEEQAGFLKQFCHTFFSPDNGQPIPTLPGPSVMIDIPVFTPCIVHKEPPPSLYT